MMWKFGANRPKWLEVLIQDLALNNPKCHKRIILQHFYQVHKEIQSSRLEFQNNIKYLEKGINLINNTTNSFNRSTRLMCGVDWCTIFIYLGTNISLKEVNLIYMDMGLDLIISTNISVHHLYIPLFFYFSTFSACFCRQLMQKI